VGPTTYGPCRRPAVGPVEGTFNGPAIGPKRKFTGVRPISITDGCFSISPVVHHLLVCGGLLQKEENHVTDLLG
jgi:hypothetical protein